MARRRGEEANVRKLSKNGGGSISITLPIELVRALGWRDGQKVEVRRSGTSLIVKDWRPKK